MIEITGTCQICGRAIKATKGVIAHHGYERPAGWYSQTASCMGARFLPYEVSCDRISEVIKIVEGQLGYLREHQASLAAPQTITERVRKAGDYSRYPQYDTVTYERPAGYKESPYDLPHTYGHALGRARREAGEAIRATEQQLAYLRDRLAKWAPADLEQTTREAAEARKPKGKPVLTHCGDCGEPLARLQDAHRRQSGLAPGGGLSLKAWSRPLLKIA